MRVVFLILAGLVSGILGGMGLGGGTLLIPILTIFLKVPLNIAQGINLISFVPMSVLALIFHFKNKLIMTKYLLKMGIAGVIFSVLGAFLSSLVKATLLKKLFGIFLILLGILSFITTIIQIRKEKQAKEGANEQKNAENTKKIK